MAINIILPGFHLLQSSIKRYKKILYSFISLIFIPVIILIYYHNNISLDNNIYIKHVKGFNKINDKNYYSRFIKQKGTISINGIKTYYASNYSIKNLKRSIVPISLFLKDKSDEILFIDGFQNFYRNPIIGYYKNAVCLNYLPQWLIDDQKLPNSKNQTYITLRSDILKYLKTRKTSIKNIIDIPNLFDQTMSPFRFSDEYYTIIKNHLTTDGIFGQIFDLSNCRSEFLDAGVINFKKNFKEIIGFLFTNHLVIMGSNSPDSFTISWKNIYNGWKLLRGKERLFFNNTHLLSHLIFTDIDDLLVYLRRDDIEPFYFLNSPQKLVIDKNVTNKYISNNINILGLIEDTKSSNPFKKKIREQFEKNNKILSILKKTDIFEAHEKYEKETEYLYILKKIALDNPYLRYYLYKILLIKEEFYFLEATRHENERKWEAAKKLYKAILIINEDNFEANYRLGKLCITLQEINNAFKYLNHAMKLKKGNPRVLYQMGVLLFSSGRAIEAIEYLEQALHMKGKNPSLFLYLGLCYEELGKLKHAKEYYDIALTSDPDNINIMSSMERVIKKIEELKFKWKRWNRASQSDVEEGENMPLPITESAKKVRQNALNEETKSMGSSR